jgi:uncharacterized protein YdhG (YjbR/CyaY superfamily)/GNAT superfamily N-acetyltransferase
MWRVAKKPTTIDEYLAGVSPDRRAALERLRKTIRALLPDAEECISYAMPAFRFDGHVVAGFLATAKGCSYFPFSGTTLARLSAELTKYSRTKSALHFDPQRPLPIALVRKLVKVRIAETALRKTGEPSTRSRRARTRPIQAKGHAARRTAVGMVFREVTTATWTDFETLFEARGGPKNCWCMVWRATPKESRTVSGPGRKAAMKSRIDAGTPVGILGYQDGVPVAWCSIAPRDTYRPGLADNLDEDRAGSVWSLVCFYVPRDARGQGAIHGLIEAAKQTAKAHGATHLEAYPVDVDSPSYRFGGFLPTFERSGFVTIGRAGSRRHVVRYLLT